MMHAFDVWANLMSLGAIDFGIIVDGAVIIVESTVFMLHEKVLKGKEITAKVRDKVAYGASSKMMNSAFFGQVNKRCDKIAKSTPITNWRPHNACN